MQDLGAFGFLIECPFDGLHLASDSSYAIEQFLFFFCRVSHKKPDQVLTSIPRRVYADQGLRFASQQFQKKGGSFMSDGSNSLQQCEEVSGTESAEPPSSYGLARL